MEHKGEIAKLRRMIRAYDMCLSLCETDAALGLYEYREVQALIEATMKARLEEEPEYWKTRCYEAEIEWVCNIVSAMMVNEAIGFRVDTLDDAINTAIAILS